jgi:hypothetical protein
LKTILLVALLAGCALVDLATPNHVPPEQPLPTPAVAIAVPAVAAAVVIRAPDARNPPTDRPALSESERYPSAPNVNQGTSYDGNVFTYEHD